MGSDPAPTLAAPGVHRAGQLRFATSSARRSGRRRRAAGRQRRRRGQRAERLDHVDLLGGRHGLRLDHGLRLCGDGPVRADRSTVRMVMGASVLSAAIACASTFALASVLPVGRAMPTGTAAPTGATTSAALATIAPWPILRTIRRSWPRSRPPWSRSPSPPGRSSGVGTGIVLTADGLVLTNDHVVAGGGGLTVTLQDGRVLDASLVVDDAAADLAVIRAADERPDACQVLGDSSSVQVGAPVLAIGSPLGTYTETCHQGGSCPGSIARSPSGNQVTGRPTDLSPPHPDRRGDQSREQRRSACATPPAR